MRIWFALGVLAATAQHGFAATAADIENGRRLAKQWCASCHVVSPDQESATTEAPPFEAVAKSSPAELEKLDVFLTAPHGPMPPISLSRTEIRDLVAYISSLRDSD